MEIKTPLVKTPIGLGDVVKKATTRLHIKMCDACKKRQEQLNKIKFLPK